MFQEKETKIWPIAELYSERPGSGQMKKGEMADESKCGGGGGTDYGQDVDGGVTS